MKKQIFSIAMGLFMTALTTATFASSTNATSNPKLTAKEKAVKNFTNQFENVSDPSVILKKEGMILQSEADDHAISSAYDKKGNWLYTIKLYPAENLAGNIVKIITDHYNNYYITKMEKVDQPGKATVFVVHMQNDDSFKTLRVVNRDVELIQDFKKG
ncbi:MAG: hypothetical protein M3139_01185 [Bacteroidota bacterium]|nr:hypothetical protein [Bacteroidota bacterium]